MEILTDKLVMARKSHTCDASSAWLRNANIDEPLTNDERLILDAVKADGWKILKGQVYRRITGKWDGEMGTMRMRQDMDSIVTRHELWDEE